jgi:hypothetical protein
MLPAKHIPQSELSGLPKLSPELEDFATSIRAQLQSLCSAHRTAFGFLTAMHALIDREIRDADLQHHTGSNSSATKPALSERLLLLKRIVATIDGPSRAMVCGVAGIDCPAGNMAAIGSLSKWLAAHKDSEQADLLFEILAELDKKEIVMTEVVAEKIDSSSHPKELGCTCEFTRTIVVGQPRRELVTGCSLPALYIETGGDKKGSKTCQKHHIMLEKKARRTELKMLRCFRQILQKCTLHPRQAARVKSW